MHGACLVGGLCCIVVLVLIDCGGVDRLLWLQIGYQLHQLVDAVGLNVLYMGKQRNAELVKRTESD